MMEVTSLSTLNHVLPDCNYARKGVEGGVDCVGVCEGGPDKVTSDKVKLQELH